MADDKPENEKEEEGKFAPPQSLAFKVHYLQKRRKKRKEEES